MATRNPQQQFIPAVLGPDLQRRQLDMQRNQLMAQQLLQSEAPQGQMVSGHYVAPSITQHLAHALRQYQGNRMMGELPQQAADLQRAQMQQMAAAFGLDSGAPRAQPGAAQAMPVSGGQPSPQAYAAALSGGQPPMQAQPQMPLLPGRSPQESFMVAQSIGMPEYMKLVAQQGAPTNEQRNLSFLPPEMRNQLISAQFLNEAGKDGVQMVMGQDGRMYAVPVAGYAQAQAQQAGAIAGAQAGAQAQYDLTAVPDGRGGTQMMPRSQAVHQLSRGASAASQAATPAAGQFGRAPSSGEQSYDTEMGKSFAQRYEGLQENAANARDMLGMYDLAEQALDAGVRTGIAGEAELTLRQLGAAMGMDTSPDKVAAGELIRAVQNRMALIMRNPEGGMGMPGAISDRDIKFLKDSQIGIDRTPEGNRQMLAAFRAIEQRKVQVAELADQYVQQHGRLDAGFNRALRDYADANPLFAATEPDARVRELDSILGF